MKRFCDTCIRLMTVAAFIAPPLASPALANDKSASDDPTSYAAKVTPSLSDKTLHLETSVPIKVHSNVTSNAVRLSDITLIASRGRSLPEFVIALNADINITAQPVPDFYDARPDDDADDLLKVDLVGDSPLFIGTRGASEFDTRDALRERGMYPVTLNIDPLFTVAGAGIETSF